MLNKINTRLLILGIFLLAAFFRLYGLNWDQGQHLHPDERFLVMVTTGITWPNSFHQYLDATTSSLNPQNRGFGFFVYGTFPIFFTKLFADFVSMDDYFKLLGFSRMLSALVDLGTVILVLLIAKQISKSEFLISKSPPTGGIPLRRDKSQNIKSNLFQISNFKFQIFPLFAMFFYACSVLPIQLSHFYAVDTYLTFFLTLSFYLLTRIINSNKPTTHNISRLSGIPLHAGQLTTLLGISLGLALASKISAVLFLPILGLGLIIFLIKQRNIVSFIFICCLLSVVCYLTFRVAQPYLFTNANIFDITFNQKVLDNWKQLKSFDNPSGWFPPAVQWITTKPYIFPLKNLLFWGLGLPLGILSIFAVVYQVLSIMYYVFKKINHPPPTTHHSPLTINPLLTLCLFWVLLLFIYQGGQFVKALRYFYPIYPFLAILAAWFVCQIFKKFKIGLMVYCVIGLLVLIYPLSFLSIYARPNSRVATSEWIYNNIPPGSVLSHEHWDDALPLGLVNHPSDIFKGEELPMYYGDDQKKWSEISTKLDRIDYIVLSSNRLYGSIMTVPQKYPVTNKFYTALFNSSLGFEKVAEFTSRPNLPIPFLHVCLTPPFVRYGIVALKSQECPQTGISFVDDYADETFTVYDHPKVLIFKKTPSYSSSLLQKVLSL